MILIDVKKIGWRKKKEYGETVNRGRTPEQKLLGVKFCYVDIVQETIQIREPRSRAPSRTPEK